MREKSPLLARALESAKGHGVPKAPEMDYAEKIVLQQHQRQHYQDTIDALTTNKRCPLQDQLGVCLDEDGLLRCQSRLENASLPGSAKRPLLVSRYGILSKLIITQTHGRLFMPVHLILSHKFA